ncbi:N-glycosylase/DNA lyase [Rhodotorula toruloides]|uniref:DNA-(apurinic or apyrimidinic site) lyase n=1 Tax=Rhodotorula toruloides TaxID=5286 RepID=A0A511KGR8_RHOTO|nr:N-glycosylase/DNA lyase [Rhodotorula toruloides]
MQRIGQADSGIYYRALYPFAPPHSAYVADLAHDTTTPLVRAHFQLDVDLDELHRQWARDDPRFRRKIEMDSGNRLEGIRVLKQDEWETLVSFICSANNNIARITLMVNRLCAALGSPLPHPSHFTPSCVHSPSLLPSAPLSPPNDSSLFSFPPPQALADPKRIDPLLRQLGFGYRAPFIPSTAQTLLSTASALGVSPQSYLASLNRDEFTRDGKGIAQARERLVEFKGVGRKVADCVLLFGMGWNEIVPVDTHVFQIAVRDYSFPSPRSASLTPQLHDRVSSFLADKWGPYAGWAQQVLFFADLKSGSLNGGAEKVGKVEIKEAEEMGEQEEQGRERKRTFEEEVQALLADPTIKRRRSSSVAKGPKVQSAVVVESKIKRGREEKGKGKKGVKVKEEEEVEVEVEIEATVKLEGEQGTRLADVKTEQVVAPGDGVNQV